MKDTIFLQTNSNNKKTEAEEKQKEGNSLLHSSNLHCHKKPKCIIRSALLSIQNFHAPLISTATGLPLNSIYLKPDRLYTIGRTSRCCDFIFEDRRVSKRHCQILFDSFHHKIYIIDGTFLLHVSATCILDELRKRLGAYDEVEGQEKESLECSMIKASLNGVFINGIRVKRGMVRELCTGDEVLLVCGNEGLCSLGMQFGFVIQAVVFKEEVAVRSIEFQVERPIFIETATSVGHSQGSISSGRRNKRVAATRANEITVAHCDTQKLKYGDLVERAKFLSSQCRHVLFSKDSVTYIQEHTSPCMKAADAFNKKLNCSCDRTKLPPRGETGNAGTLVLRKAAQPCERGDPKYVHIGCGNLVQEDIAGFHSKTAIADNNYTTLSSSSMSKENAPHVGGVIQKKSWENCRPSPGKKFYLNRLQFMDHCLSGHHNIISLPELLYPVKSIVRMFIATFTSDILWFLSYCKIPCHLPVTIACHNNERCWSSSPDKRTSVPYSDFPNLVLVFSPFPEAIAFGKDRKRHGIACHHPKFLVLQREDSIRVIITSANLVANQWNNVTNTVWWQDFPSRRSPDFSSLFVRISGEEINHDSRSDFAAQLAGFMASLVVDVPSQAHWIMELTKYDFEGAMGHLVASVPGIHSCRNPSVYQSVLQSFGEKFLGSVEASVVGLSHLFHTEADTKGAQIKRLAAFLMKSHENSYGMSGVVLRRNTNVPADANAVDVLVSNPGQSSQGDCIQLGFLPRYIAKWVSPLWDSGFLRFSGYIYPKEALAAALEGSGMRVQLILHVSQGPCFPDMIKMMQPEHIVAFCSLVASIQRCTGLWRLEEVLGQYKWPDLEQSDFVYGSSSIGTSVNAQFLAAFSAAAGKRSLQLCDSEESDPEWGCWSASQELRNPSIRIIFPTIGRIKNAWDGIFPSRRILCFSEKTWEKLRTLGILHDAVPYPNERVGRPMHVKVARRRFQSKTDASSVGWVYCGSHNFSAAAWGRSILNSMQKPSEFRKTDSSVGLRLHICNYELGIIFIFPPKESKGISTKDPSSLDDVVLPFVVPAPKYGPTDRPATGQAMREALAELSEQEKERLVELAAMEEMVEEIPDEEDEVVGPTDYAVEEKEEEKAYAEMLWSQVDLSQSC